MISSTISLDFVIIYIFSIYKIHSFALSPSQHDVNLVLVNSSMFMVKIEYGMKWVVEAILGLEGIGGAFLKFIKKIYKDMGKFPWSKCMLL